MKLLLKTAIAGGALAMACAAHAGILYSQAYDGTGNLYSSQNDISGGNGLFAQVWDDFQLSSDSNVNGVAWTGGYFNGSPAPISQFFLGLYADAGGTPGALMAYGNFGGNGGESCGAGPIPCTYSVSFADYTMSAGTYWVSVVPDIGFPPQWGWATSATGTGNAYQCFLGTCNTIGGANMAFDIMGAPVPEPETWALMLLGLGGVGVASRSRRRVESRAA